MSEMRLIDANALKTRINNVPMHGDADVFYDIMGELVSVVASAPTVDAEVVRHGRWTKKDNSKTCTRIGDYEEWYECSECEGSAERESEFCPWCRAKMDAKEDA